MDWLTDLLNRLPTDRPRVPTRTFGESRFNPANQHTWLDLADWKSIIIFAHGLPFYEVSYLLLPPNNLHRVYESLLPHAYAQMKSLGEGDFLYELALTHESNELEGLLPLAFEQLRLPPLYPFGLAFHLLIYISKVNVESKIDLAHEVDRFLEDPLRRQPSVIVPPPEIDPILGDLFSAARRSWDTYELKEKAQGLADFQILLLEVQKVYTDYAKANNYLFPPPTRTKQQLTFQFHHIPPPCHPDRSEGSGESAPALYPSFRPPP